MNLYLVLGTSQAPSCLVGTQIDAKALARERGTSWEKEEVPTDKAGLMAYVNRLRADVNAEMHLTRDEIVNSNTPEAQAEAKRLMNPSHLDQSIAFDDAFEAMPLAQKLHFAALAMEAAREELK